MKSLAVRPRDPGGTVSCADIDSCRGGIPISSTSDSIPITESSGLRPDDSTVPVGKSFKRARPDASALDDVEIGKRPCLRSGPSYDGQRNVLQSTANWASSSVLKPKAQLTNPRCDPKDGKSSFRSGSGPSSTTTSSSSSSSSGSSTTYRPTRFWNAHSKSISDNLWLCSQDESQKTIYGSVLRMNPKTRTRSGVRHRKQSNRTPGSTARYGDRRQP